MTTPSAKPPSPPLPPPPRKSTRYSYQGKTVGLLRSIASEMGVQKGLEFFVKEAAKTDEDPRVPHYCIAFRGPDGHPQVLADMMAPHLEPLEQFAKAVINGLPGSRCGRTDAKTRVFRFRDRERAAHIADMLTAALHAPEEPPTLE